MDKLKYKKYTRQEIEMVAHEIRQDKHRSLHMRPNELEQYVDWVLRLVVIAQKIFGRAGKMIPGWFMWAIGILSVRKEIIKLIQEIIDKFKNKK